MGRSGMDPIQRLMGLMCKAHPWHGVSIGEQAPDVVTTYIEIVPTDTVKYEVDKQTGLPEDRPASEILQCGAGALWIRASNVQIAVRLMWEISNGWVEYFLIGIV